jgi:hypothetical protein
MSSSSRISNAQAIDLNSLKILTAQIKKLRNIHFEGQVEHLIKTDPDWQVVFDQIEDKSAALEQVYDLVQEKLAVLDQAKNELEALLHKQITHDKRRDALPSFRGFAQDAIFQHWLTFTDNVPEALSLVNVRFYNQVNDPMYWRLRLQRDFGMSSGYFALITKNEDKMTAAAKMKMVHKRLSKLRRRDPSDYRLIYQPMIENNIEFPPLTATTIESLSAMNKGQILFYLQEASRLENAAFVESMLVKTFDESAGFSPDDWRQFTTVRGSILSITEKSNNRQLLRKMALVSTNPYNIQVIVDSIKKIDSQNEWLQPGLRSNEAGTLYLNEVISDRQYQWARELLQTGVVPDANTLKRVLALKKIQNGNIVYDELTYYVLSLSKQYPQMLCQVWQEEGIERYRKNLYGLLEHSNNMQLLQTVYDVLSSHLKEYNVSLVLNSLLKLMAIHGDWSRMEPYLQSEELFSARYITLMNCAIKHGQLAVLKQLISPHLSPSVDDTQDEEKQINRQANIDYLVRNELYSITTCSHVDIIQYLLEELQLPVEFGPCFFYAVKLGHVEVIKYFVEQAPQEKKETPTSGTLSLAISSNQKPVVQYLVEDCGILPQEKHIEKAITNGNYDVSLYLLRIRSKMILRLSDETFSALIDRSTGFREAKKLLNWIAGPEGREHGFQFDMNHLRVILKDKKYLPESMALSPEFPGLVKQLNDKEKNDLIEQMLLAASVFSPSGNPLTIDRSIFSVLRVLVNLMKTEVDSQDHLPHDRTLSLSSKLKLFMLALAHKDKALAKLFLSQENEFLHLAFSWDHLANQKFLKDNAYQINPEMLAWLEMELNTKIPDATLTAILNQYANCCGYHHDVSGVAENQDHQAIQHIYLTTFNKHRDFRFSDPQSTTIKMVSGRM